MTLSINCRADALNHTSICITQTEINKTDKNKKDYTNTKQTSTNKHKTIWPIWKTAMRCTVTIMRSTL